MPNFTTTNSKRLRSTAQRSIEIPKVPASIGTDMNTVMTNWPREAATMAWLAPTRKDLLIRIQRNGLPLGYRSQEWGEGYQTNCVLCIEQTIETSKHLFWQCAYAKEIWDIYKVPWRIKECTAQWPQVLQEEHLVTTQRSKYDAKYWTVVRACNPRVIWLERNLRIFNPTNKEHKDTQRANQARLDIKAYIEIACRRSKRHKTEEINNTTTYLRTRYSTYNKIMTTNLLK